MSVKEQENPPGVMQLLANARINPWAVQLMCEDLLKHPEPIPVDFFFPINRGDCPGHTGVRVRLTPISLEEKVIKDGT